LNLVTGVCCRLYSRLELDRWFLLTMIALVTALIAVLSIQSAVALLSLVIGQYRYYADVSHFCYDINYKERAHTHTPTHTHTRA